MKVYASKYYINAGTNIVFFVGTEYPVITKARIWLFAWKNRVENQII